MQNEWAWASSTNRLFGDLKPLATIGHCLHSLLSRNVKSIIGRHVWQKDLTTLAEGSVRVRISLKTIGHNKNVQQLLKAGSQLLNSAPM